MLLKIGRILTVILIITFTNSLYAEEKTSFPSFIKCKYQGVEYRCFDLESLKDLASIEAERDYYYNVSNNLKKRIETRKEMMTACRKALKIQDSVITSLSENNMKWFNKYIEENELRHRAENKSDFMKNLGWGVAGGFALTTLVLGSIMVLD